MFASDDEFDKQLAVEKEKREQDVQKKKDMLKKTEDVENTALKDNWDDKEGYYVSFVGEIFAYKYRVVRETGRVSSRRCCAALIRSPTRRSPSRYCAATRK